MSAPQFTKGPWRAVDTDDGEASWPEYELFNIAGETVCELQHFARRSTAEANARLIAAAPELYEALDALLKIITEAQGVRHPDAVIDAASALAKARGQ